MEVLNVSVFWKENNMLNVKANMGETFARFHLVVIEKSIPDRGYHSKLYSCADRLGILFSRNIFSKYASKI